MGKTSTIMNMLNKPKDTWPGPFEGSSGGVKKFDGYYCGMKFCFIDTPGLSLSAGQKAANISMLRKVQRSLGKDGVRAVMYVDRADVSRRGMVDVPAMQ